MLTIVLWVVGVVVGLVVLYIGFMVVGTLWTNARGTEPEGVEVEASATAGCRVGEDVTVSVTVRDTLGKARVLNNVDLDAAYLEGLVVQRIEPPVEDQPSKPTLGTYVYEFGRPIAAGGAAEVRFTCRAAKAGDFRGDVTVYVDSGAFRYVRKPIRTVVVG